MKKSIKKYFCDIEGCERESPFICGACQKDLCYDHYWLVRSPGWQGYESVKRGMKEAKTAYLCEECLKKRVYDFDALSDAPLLSSNFKIAGDE